MFLIMPLSLRVRLLNMKQNKSSELINLLVKQSNNVGYFHATSLICVEFMKTEIQ